MKMDVEISSSIDEVCNENLQTSEFIRMIKKLIQNQMDGQPLFNDLYDLVEKVKTDEDES